jgi:hypothetical protein
VGRFRIPGISNLVATGGHREYFGDAFTLASALISTVILPPKTSILDRLYRYPLHNICIDYYYCSMHGFAENTIEKLYIVQVYKLSSEYFAKSVAICAG